jgi:hypothetical protein
MDEIVQHRPVDELHDEEQMPLRRLAEVIDRHDIRVAEPRHRPRLAAETLRKSGIDADLQRQQFDRDQPIERLLSPL